jgi:hypothetical protein
MPPRKILFASTVALILIILSITVVYRKSSSKDKGELGILVSSENTATSINSLGSSNSNSPESTNQTDILSKQVFTNYIALQQSGNLNESNVQALTDQLSAQILDSSASAKTYTVFDLKVIAGATPEEIKDYGDQLFLIRTKYQNAYIRGSIAPNSPYIDPSESGMMRVFKDLQNLYERVVVDLSQMSVPDGLAELHLQLMNIYSASAFGLSQFSQLDIDPVAALSGLNVYNKNSDQEEVILQKIARYFVNNGIIFSTNDPGYGFSSI